MIAPFRKSLVGQLAEFGQNGFLIILPQIRRQVEIAVRHLRGDVREEFIAEVIARAYCMWFRLAAQGRAQIARPTPLARFAMRQVRAERRVGSRANGQDVFSATARRKHGFGMERLDRIDNQSTAWQQLVVEDRRAGPAETAAARVDLAAWLRTLSTRNRRIAMALACGETTGIVAQQFGLSAGRVSQLRSWLRQHWERFQLGTGTSKFGI